MTEVARQTGRLFSDTKISDKELMSKFNEAAAKAESFIFTSTKGDSDDNYVSASDVVSVL